MKVSVERALERAKLHSKQFPNDDVWVMDKKWSDAVVCANDWVYRERILAGWHVVAKFRAGKRVDG